MDTPLQEPEIQNFFGIVAMIDALGVSNYSIKECEIFIKDLKEINSETKKFIEMMIATQKTLKVSGKIDQDITKIMKNVKTSQFGDTIILAWPLEEKYDSVNLMIILLVAANVIGILQKGLIKKIPFRGSISVGEFVWEDANARILGPAISDANNWYNSTDWFGVIFTPQSNFWLSSHIENEINTDPNASFLKMLKTFICEYDDVPLKKSDNSPKKQEKLFVIGWPVVFYWFTPSKLNHKQIFNQLLFDLSMPKGTELKFKNTNVFFEWYGKEIFEKDKDRWTLIS